MPKGQPEQKSSAEPAKERWAFGDFYLDQPHPDRGGQWYACRYDRGTRNVRRKSLGTSDFESAKQKLVALAAISPFAADEAPHPKNVLTLDVMRAYLLGHASGLRTEVYAKRAFDLVLAYLKDRSILAAPVSYWTPSRQLDFARYLHDKHEHKATTIERIMAVLISAFKDAALVKTRTDPLGSSVEGALMSHAPALAYRKDRIIKELRLPDQTPDIFVPTMEEMAKFIDALHYRHLRRWVVIALATWARPEAITEFQPLRQYDRRTGLINLDIEGRRLTNKRRAKIPAPQALKDALDVWYREDVDSAREAGLGPPDPWFPLMRGPRPVATVKRGVKLTANSIGLQGLTQKSTRTFMATMVMKLCPSVSREFRSRWLAHTIDEGSRTTNFYEKGDPTYLNDVALATDYVLQQLDILCTKPFLTVELLLNHEDLTRIGAKRVIDLKTIS